MFHPRLHLAADGGLLAVAAAQQFQRYDTAGERLWTERLPESESSGARTIAIDLPTRDDRLSRLGVSPGAGRDQLRTGYLRLKLDTLLNAGWLQQVQVSDLDTAKDASSVNGGFQIGVGMPFEPGISILRASGNAIMIRTEDGFVHVFDRAGALERTFQVGEAAVTDLLVRGGRLKAACCAGRLTMFERGQVSATTELPEHFMKLEDCESGVLAWKLKSVWRIDPSGRVLLAAESERPIRGVWGGAAGFYVLAGELASFGPTVTAATRRGADR